jgi:hypothetical protein
MRAMFSRTLQRTDGMHRECRLVRSIPFNVTCAVCVLAACGDSDVTDDAPKCGLLLDPAVVIGPTAGPEGPSLNSQIVRSAGLYFVTNTFSPGQVSVFDSRGELLHTIGAQGRGPGENMATTHVAVAGDTVYVLDYDLMRIQAFRVNGDYVGVAGRLQEQTPFGSLRDESGFVLMRAAGGNGPGIVERIEGNSVTARVEISNDATVKEDKGTAQFADAGESVWVGFTRQYLIEQYRYDSGQRLHRISARYPYFPDTHPASELEGADSIAGLSDIAVNDANHLLALHMVVPAPKPNRNATERVPGGMVSHPWKAVIQVFDATTGKLVARHIANQTRLQAFADGSHVYALTEHADGNTVAEVFRIYVVKPNSREACEE